VGLESSTAHPDTLAADLADTPVSASSDNSDSVAIPEPFFARAAAADQTTVPVAVASPPAAASAAAADVSGGGGGEGANVPASQLPQPPSQIPQVPVTSGSTPTPQGPTAATRQTEKQSKLPEKSSESAGNTSVPGLQAGIRSLPTGDVASLQLRTRAGATTPNSGSSEGVQDRQSPSLRCRVTGDPFTLKADRQPVDMPCCGATVCAAALKEVRLSRLSASFAPCID
jgi:hypothetical protein